MTAAASGSAWIEPTRAGRVRLVLERAAIFAWFMSHLWWVPAVADRIDGANPYVSVDTLQFLFAYAMVVTCVPTLLNGWWAWHILRAGQSPTPGSRVLSAGGGYAPNYLAGLGSFWSAEKFTIAICGDCGLTRYYASPEARAKLKQSEVWRRG